MEDLHALIGIGGFSVSTLISRLKEDNGLINKDKEKENKEILNKAIEEQIAKSARRPEPNNYGITVKGESNLMVRFAKCCSPVPGDDILGYITKGRGVSVHRKDCSNLQNLIDTDEERVIEVNWGSSQGTAYFAEIEVQADDRDGLLADIMSVITELKLQLSAVNANLAKQGFALINVKLKITSVDSLKDLMKRLKR
jgi:GTP pyrophosphokinase